MWTGLPGGGGGGGLLSGRQCYIGDPWEGEADRVGPYQTRTGQVGPAGRLIYHNHPPLVASRSLYSVRNKFFFLSFIKILCYMWSH